MGAPNVETCSRWCTVAAVRDRPEAADWTANAPTDATVLRWIDVASWLLFHATGRQWAGLCSDTVRPCRRETGGAPYAVYPWGTWRWASGWGDAHHPIGRACGCARTSELTLGAAPIVDVLAVTIDGVTLAEDSYRIDDGRWLIRVDGEVWPSCQDLTLPLTDANTFGVTFTYGTPPPIVGQEAAALLAAQLCLAALPVASDACALPERLQTITRQGVSYTILDPFAFLEKGQTGLFLVDLFISQANPGRAQRTASVHNPDIPRPVRRTSQLGGS